MDKIVLAGDFANLRLLAQDLDGDENFVGELQLAAKTQPDGATLDHGPWSELVILIVRGGITGASGAVAKAAVEAAIKRARGRGKITREDSKE